MWTPLPQLLMLVAIRLLSATHLRGGNQAPLLAPVLAPLDATLVAWYAEQYKEYNVSSRILRRPIPAGGGAAAGSGHTHDTGPQPADCNALEQLLQLQQPRLSANSNASAQAQRAGRQVTAPGHSLRYNFSIPLTRRLAGLSYVGHGARLRLLLQRIRRGEAVVVGGLGGSITAGQGVGLSWTRGWLGHMDTWLNAALPPLEATRARCAAAAAAAATSGAGTGGSSAFAGAAEETSREAAGPLRMRRVGRSVLQQSGVQQRGAADTASLQLRPQLTRHVVHSGAVPGTQSSYVSACLAQHLPPAPDLVLVEFAVNDPPTPSPAYTDPARRAFERLLRKLLRLPSRPAVVLVNMYAHNAPAPDGSGCCKFWNTAERDFGELAAHYGLPAISLKAAVWAHTAANTSGSEALAAGALFNAGRYHPGPGGHVVAFELLLTLLQELAAADWRLAHALARQQHDTAAAAAGGGEAQHLAAAEAELRAEFEAEAARPLPAPLGAENWEPERGSSCLIQQE